MPDLITRERAIRNLDNRSLTAEEALLVDALIAAASRAIERHCRRAFAAAEHDDLHDGTTRPLLLLDHYPILSVERVAYEPTVVLRVANTSAANQRASVQVTNEGVRLLCVASGVTAISELTFAANATLGSLSAAITALGAGWSAAVADSAYGAWASADLRALQGAYPAKDSEAGLRIHVRELTEYDIDRDRGALVKSGAIWPSIAADSLGWRRERNFWRIVYTAGFETVPDDVQEACACWVAALFWQGKRDPGLVQESIPAVVSRTVHQDMPPLTRALLRPYRALWV